jgi:hypothetical protein
VLEIENAQRREKNDQHEGDSAYANHCGTQMDPLDHRGHYFVDLGRRCRPTTIACVVACLGRTPRQMEYKKRYYRSQSQGPAQGFGQTTRGSDSAISRQDPGGAPREREVEQVLLDSVGGPVGKRGEVYRRAAHRRRLLVRLPPEHFLGHSIEAFSGVGHFMIELT